MSLFSKIVDFISGGIGEKIVDTVKDYFPPKMSEEEKRNLEAAIRQATREHELKLLEITQQQQEEFNSRIIEMEGTAKDLNQSGWLGRIVIFLRGAQRPLWGYLVLYMDIMVFSGYWKIQDEQLQSAFWVINLLVLGFLFGERAVRNVMPLLQKKFGNSEVIG